MSWWLGGFWDSKNQTFILNTAVHISTHLLFTGKVVAWLYSAPIGGVPSRNWVLVTRLLVFPPRATTFNFPPSDPMARSHKNNQWWGHPRGFQLSPSASSDKARINSNVSAVCQKSLRSFDILGLMIRMRHLQNINNDKGWLFLKREGSPYSTIILVQSMFNVLSL